MLVLKINIERRNIFVQLGENVMDHFNSIFPGEDMNGIYFFKRSFDVEDEKLFCFDESWKNLCFKCCFFMLEFVGEH